METITYVCQSCIGCPTIFDITFSDGSPGYIRFRYGRITLRKEDAVETLLEEEQISDGLDGVISWEDTVKWLESKNYVVQSSRD